MLKIFQKPEERHAARERRLAHWDRPITSRRQRFAAWVNLLFSDHGVIRLAYLNEWRVSDELRRSAQPAPHDIARLARQGVRTIVNLRGGREQGAWPLQRDACQRHGIELREITLRSREAPSKELLLSLPEFFASLRYPALAHCKSGADRAGLFSALYVLIRQGQPVAAARKQLSLAFGHVRMAKTGVLDAFLDAFEREGEAQGIGFMDWVRDIYDPARLQAEFHEGFWSSLLVDKVMRRE